MPAQRVLQFWFEELDERAWWTADEATDALVRRHFARLLQRAAAGELDSWRDSDEGRLAEIIVLDQFSRTIHRGRAAAFANDAMALALSQEAVRRGVHDRLEGMRAAFLLMPYMHSESAAIHERALALFTELGLDRQLDFERRHKAIIDRFGRYPHRNKVLGRASTPEEIAFLKQPGSGF